MRSFGLLFVVLMLLTGCAPIALPSDMVADQATSSSPEMPTSTALVFEDVRLFDGEEVTPGATVVVEDGLIVAVGMDVAIPPGAQVIDGDGQTLLPGLIDAHTHTFTQDALRQMLIFGVTTTLDMFTDHRFAAQMRQEQGDTAVVDRADLYSAGTLATAPDGHGTQFGLSIPTLTSADEAEPFVQDRIAEGSDYIKIVIEEGAELGMTLPTLDQATVTALVQAAQAEGILSVVHVQTLAAAQQALAAGADGLAHIFTDAVPEQAFIDEAVASGLFVIPTLTVFQHIGNDSSAPVDSSVIADPLLSPYLTLADLQTLNNPYTGSAELSLATGQEAVRLLFEAGVPILAGTDAQNPGATYGASLHRELALLVESGLSPLDVLRSATSVTADVFSLADRGRIAPGLRADLLLVNGDPTTSITATRDIVGVWKLGVPADRDGYLAGVKARNAAAETQVERFDATGVVVVTDFESEDLDSSFGSVWQVTTDQQASGTSTAEIEIVGGGADGSNFSLQVTGEIGDAFPFAWAGVMYMPGATPFAPFDLSSKPTLHFWARGEGGPFRIQLFCANLGQFPLEQPFSVMPEWQEVELDLRAFGGCDVEVVQAVIFSAGPEVGAFSFQIDDVSFR